MAPRVNAEQAQAFRKITLRSESSGLASAGLIGSSEILYRD